MPPWAGRELPAAYVIPADLKSVYDNVIGAYHRLIGDGGTSVLERDNGLWICSLKYTTVVLCQLKFKND